MTKQVHSSRRPILVAPSMLSSDFAKLNDEVRALEAAGADWLHVDVMDGNFAPNLTMGPFIVAALRRLSKLPLDCHLMIQDPVRYVEAFVKAGASSITVHPEAKGDIHSALKLIRKLGARPSLSIKPATPVKAAEPFGREMEMLLIMTVNPGFSGQTLMPECLPKYQEARELFGPKLLLQIDGGVTVENIDEVLATGVDVIVTGATIFKSQDYAETVRILKGER